MRMRSPDPHGYVSARPVIPCAKCGRMLFGPEWSEYVSAYKIRHLWSCSACDHSFETQVTFKSPGRGGKPTTNKTTTEKKRRPKPT